MIFRFLLVFGTILVVAHGRVRQLGKIDVDQLRYDFLEQENALWNFVQDQTINRVKETDLAEVSLIREFEKFGDKTQEVLPQNEKSDTKMFVFKKFPHDINYGLQSLEGVWAYAFAYTDLRAVYALYETFRRFQALQTGESRIPSPRQAWIDLTRAILEDPKNNVNESLNRLHYMVEQKNLFVAAMKVNRHDGILLSTKITTITQLRKHMGKYLCDEVCYRRMSIGSLVNSL